MADNDLQAELDNLFGSSENTNTSEEKDAASEAPAAEAQSADASPAEAQEHKAPAAAAPKGKAMMGGKAGARPLGGKAFPKTATVSGGMPMPAPAAAAPTAAAAAAAPAVPAAAPAAIPASVALRGNAPSASPSKVPLILSGLSLLFTLVCIIMVNNVGSKVGALQTAIEAQSRAQLDILNKQTKALNEQTTTIKKLEKVLEDQLLRKDSDFQKRMRIVSDAIEEVREILPKK